MNPPLEILEKLKEIAQSQQHGLASAWSEDLGIIIMGTTKYNINEVAIIAAHLLLEGVMEGSWMKATGQNAPLIVSEPTREM